ncbi:MAG: ArsA family ATPase [Acidimicrobiales bacterium]|jgi:anion-transporting  ArsA/GET3 family ATPase
MPTDSGPGEEEPGDAGAIESSTGLSGLVSGRSVVVCCGSGGTGKTTISAALGLAGAEQGRRTCVVTIDPARRLADALGLDELENTPRKIAGDWDGELSAVMLDAKSTFDDLITRYSETPEQAERILQNRLYRNLTSALSGTQEYMAMEKLFELHSEGGFDLVVVDTPPTRHALDFVDAPRRLYSFLENRVFRLVLMPTRAYLKAMTFAANALLRTIAKVAGSEIVEDAMAFFRAFEGMEQGFRDRARLVEQLLADPGTAFVLVTAPREDSIAEARFFARRLAQSSIPVSALVVNRLFPSFAFDEQFPAEAKGAPDEVSRTGPADPLAYHELERNLADFLAVSVREGRYVSELADEVGQAPVVRVPFLMEDVHDLAGLGSVARHLLRGN